MNIDKIIDECVEQALYNGYTIVTHSWGVHPVNDLWVSPSKMCCPLGAVLVKYNKLPPLYLYGKGAFPNCDLSEVRYNPADSIIHLFGVDYNWIKSFWYGIINQRIGYAANYEAQQLGLKYYLKIRNM